MTKQTDRERVLKVLQAFPLMTQSMISTTTNIHSGNLYQILKGLVEEGLVDKSMITPTRKLVDAYYIKGSEGKALKEYLA